ncbi:MAG: polyphenol oxidase family protein, partial [Deltaproteobacteria bacterium]|nr:polyphenol oxidase family protein [Deltaproteobacteria bacterium]
SLGMCCFKIREDVAGRIAALPSSDTALLECDDSTFRADLKKINRAQLIDAGCLPGNIEMSDMCTACRSDLFFSHRGEQGETGRFGLLAGLAG